MNPKTLCHNSNTYTYDQSDWNVDRRRSLIDWIVAST